MRKDTTNDLLLGTNVQPKLGLAVMTRDDDGGLTNLITSSKLAESTSG